MMNRINYCFLALNHNEDIIDMIEIIVVRKHSKLFSANLVDSDPSISDMLSSSTFSGLLKPI
jgi:hypothetical protein